ncbi:IS110 family RNA-guided transposase [Flavobacterium psychrophilum]|uniref:IS110 family transposase n=1 Tax=Flavobacterium psychrophilum TaxID=96345 RepID=UPI00106CD6A0|nr:IS110 family transposase [Flavobacterium psychrophilum]
MCKFKHFLGIDVSKDYFDAVVIIDGNKEKPNHNQFINDYKGIKSLCKWLKEQGATNENTLVCLEHTGMYGKLIINHLFTFKFDIWVEMSLKIIRSIGVQRGKNDKVDAERIAYYAMKNHEDAQIYEPPRKIISQLKKLISLREHLVTTRAMLLRNSKELKGFEPELAKIHAKFCKSTVKGLETDLKNIEKELDNIIKSDENIKNVFEKATSVTGVGKVTALNLICYTNEFKMYETPRQLACYCGVVPFEYTSGKSVKGRPRVHFMANKKLKKQLHMCAISSIRAKGDLKDYFDRKVAEGKNKMLVINNVRNKLVHRICACVKNNKNYEPTLAS